MSFENFPYSNFHELNLDWILQKLKEAYSSENPPDYPVKSVNGQTGDVIIAIPSNFVQSVNGETGDVVLYRNPLTQFPATDEVRWNLFRICDGTETGIEFDENGASRIEGIRRIRIYDEDNPPDYPVTSVNGQTGDVQITAGVQSVNGKTGNVVTPFVNPNTDILTLDSNSPSILWGISRNVPGGNVALYITTGGTNPQAFIRYIPDGGQAINLPLLTTADIPASAGVISVNGKTGVVTLYGTDILTTENGNTIALDINSLKNAFNNDLLIPTAGQTIIQGAYNSSGGTVQNPTRIRVTGFIQVKKGDKIKFTAGTNTTGMLVGLFDTNKTYKNETPWYADAASVNILSDGYIILVFRKNAQNTAITPEEYDATTQIIPVIWDEIEKNKSDINNTSQAIENAQNSISQLQTADATHNQQISALQTADATHNQQISALQSADSTHDQQIAELQTKIGTGIKEVKFADVVSLPIRYPETGTDTDIVENMACVNAVLSHPGVQRTNLTIVFYNGYLTISGTVRGLTDIYLYLTKT